MSGKDPFTGWMKLPYDRKELASILAMIIDKRWEIIQNGFQPTQDRMLEMLHLICILSIIQTLELDAMHVEIRKANGFLEDIEVELGAFSIGQNSSMNNVLEQLRELAAEKSEQVHQEFMEVDASTSQKTDMFVKQVGVKPTEKVAKVRDVVLEAGKRYVIHGPGNANWVMEYDPSDEGAMISWRNVIGDPKDWWVEPETTHKS